MILNEIKCHINTSLGLVGRFIPASSPCVRACQKLPFCDRPLFWNFSRLDDAPLPNADLNEVGLLSSRLISDQTFSGLSNWNRKRQRKQEAFSLYSLFKGFYRWSSFIGSFPVKYNMWWVELHNRVSIKSCAHFKM